MPIIINDSAMQLKVFVVNIDSLSITYVSMGKIKYEVPKPINLTAHALSSRPAKQNLLA